MDMIICATNMLHVLPDMAVADIIAIKLGISDDPPSNIYCMGIWDITHEVGAGEVKDTQK